LLAHEIQPGDILITKMGAPPGDACLYPLDMPKAIITADCIKWTLSPILNKPSFFVNAINSQLLKAQILDITQGVAQLKVSLGRFRNIAIPVPPLTEQKAIVDEVESRLTSARKIEEDINITLLKAERLRQSVLRKAFSGNLIIGA
jgi:type I restriction enzyme, S subunit